MKVRRTKIGPVCLALLFAFAGCGPDDKVMPIPVDTTPPVVNSVSPDDGVTGVAVGTTLMVTFSERVNLGTVTITLTGPGGVTVAGSTYASSNMVFFDPTTNLVSTSWYDVTLAGNYEDLAGNVQSGPTTWTFQTGTSGDTTPPAISLRSPIVNETGVAVDANIIVTFNEDMDPGTIDNVTFTLSDSSGNVAGNVTYNVSTKTATFDPTASLAADTTFTVTIAGAEDLSGNALTTTIWSFSTGTDLTPPAMSSVVPANGTTGVALNTPISITFTENIDCSTITAFTMTVNSTSVTPTCSGATVTYTPTSDLAYSTPYTASIAAGVKDTAGNPTTTAISWTFTTVGHGGLDKSFDTDGWVTNPSTISKAVAIDSSGRILTSGGDATSSTLARYLESGALDTTFSADGMAPVNVKDSRAIAIQTDGKILVAGATGAAGDAFAVARYDIDGVIDSTFGSGGVASVTITSGSPALPMAMKIQSDGKIVIVGWATNLAGNTDMTLVRFDITGSADTGFGSGGTGVETTSISGTADDAATDVAIQSDNKIVVSGYYSNGTNYDLVLTRYDSAGVLDTNFDAAFDGIVTASFGPGLDQAFAIKLQADGNIVVAGASDGTASPDILVVRYLASGTPGGALDTSFNPLIGYIKTAVGISSAIAYDVVIQADGMIVAVGDYASAAAGRDFALVRYTSAGALDTTFDTDGVVTTQLGTGNDYAHAATIDLDGRIVVVGTYRNTTTLLDESVIVRYWP